MLVLGAGVQDVASFAAAEPNVSARTQLLATRRLHLPTRALMHACRRRKRGRQGEAAKQHLVQARAAMKRARKEMADKRWVPPLAGG